MKSIAQNLHKNVAQMGASKARIVVFLVTVAMFVIAAGAPEAGGGFIR